MLRKDRKSVRRSRPRAFLPMAISRARESWLCELDQLETTETLPPSQATIAIRSSGPRRPRSAFRARSTSLRLASMAKKSSMNTR